jgi:hypothetical protein
MLKRALLGLCLIISFQLIVLAQNSNNQNAQLAQPNSAQKTEQAPNNSQTPNNQSANTQQSSSNSQLEKFVKLDDVGVLRLMYPKQALTYKTPEENPDEPPIHEQRYQVGDVATHKIAVLNRTIGKFTQSETLEMLAMIGVEAGTDSTATIPTGIYAVLFKMDDAGTPQLIARSTSLYQKLQPFTNKIWQPALAVDVDFDKKDDLIMLQGDSKITGTYSIYHWDIGKKDFTLISDHPILSLLSFYANLNAAAQLGLEGEQAPGVAKLNLAYEKLSPKMQSLQSVDSLKRRLKEMKSLEVSNVKVMIKSETSALVRIQYRMIDIDGLSHPYEGDYQIKRLSGDQWQLDTERLKTITLPR